jgi:hypothetical protein
MKAGVSYGLLVLTVLAVVGMAVKSCVLTQDELTTCTCGSRDVTFTLTNGPAGSKHLWYNATCQTCGLGWQVVDVAWNNPRIVVDSIIESAEPPVMEIEE